MYLDFKITLLQPEIWFVKDKGIDNFLSLGIRKKLWSIVELLSGINRAISREFRNVDNRKYLEKSFKICIYYYYILFPSDHTIS